MNSPDRSLSFSFPSSDWLFLPRLQGLIANHASVGSCGEWVIPGISLAKGRVDVVDSGEADDTADESYIRQPPVRGNL